MEHKRDRANGRQVLSWAVLDILLVAIGTVTSASQMEFAPGSWGLLVVAVALETTALHLPKGMFFSFSAAPILGLGLLPQSRFMAIFAATMALVARSLRQGGWSEAVIDAVPLLLPIAVLSLANAGQNASILLSLSLYLIASSLLFRSHRTFGTVPAESVVTPVNALGLAWLSAALAGPALALLGASRPLAGGLLALGLIALQLGVGQAAAAADTREHERVEKVLLQSRARQAEAAQTLRLETEKAELKNRLTKELGERPDLDGVIRTFVDTASALAPSQTVAIFCGDQAVLYRSPHTNRIVMATTMGLREPSVTAATIRAEAVFANAQLDEQFRIFPDEGYTAVLPLHRDYVLYLGRRVDGQPFSAQEARILQFLRAEARPAFEAALQHQSLSVDAWRSKDLQHSLGRMQDLLGATAALSQSLRRDDVIGAISQGIHTLLHPSALLIVIEGQTVLADPDEMVFPTDMLGVLARARQPVFIDPPSDFGARSRFFGVPLLADGAAFGAVLVAVPPKYQDLERVEAATLLCGAGSLALRNTSLHERVQATLEELKRSQMQLIESNKMAAVGQLAAGVAHELNTPLGCIMLALENLRTEQNRKLADIALKAGTRAQTIIGNLLFYSREGVLFFQPYSLSKVVEDSIDLFHQQFDDQGIVLETSFSELPTLRGKPGHVQQVVLSLLANANDACLSQPSGARRMIWLETFVRDKTVVLSCRDSGSGVDPQVAARIFEPFFTTKPVGRGTGLGLSVARQLAQEHGGSVRLERSADPTTFVLELPLPQE